MKKQSGFTLIELLLVLAIIGIISAIAIPALLSQRARARDKAAIENLTGVIGDLVGQYDKLKEAGSTTIKASLQSYLTNNHSKDKNPWNPANAAYPTSITSAAGGSATQSAFLGTIGAPTNNGSIALAIQFPTGTTPGFIGGAVKLGNTVNNSTTFKKATAIE